MIIKLFIVYSSSKYGNFSFCIKVNVICNHSLNKINVILPENGGLILPPYGLRIPLPVHKPLTKYNKLFSANICIEAVLCPHCARISESFFVSQIAAAG